MASGSSYTIEAISPSVCSLRLCLENLSRSLLHFHHVLEEVLQAIWPHSHSGNVSYCGGQSPEDIGSIPCSLTGHNLVDIATTCRNTGRHGSGHINSHGCKWGEGLKLLPQWLVVEQASDLYFKCFKSYIVHYPLTPIMLPTPLMVQLLHYTVQPVLSDHTWATSL